MHLLTAAEMRAVDAATVLTSVGAFDVLESVDVPEQPTSVTTINAVIDAAASVCLAITPGSYVTSGDTPRSVGLRRLSFEARARMT